MRDPASWLPLAVEMSSRTLCPAFLTTLVMYSKQTLPLGCLHGYSSFNFVDIIFIRLLIASRAVVIEENGLSVQYRRDSPFSSVTNVQVSRHIY